MITRWRLAAGLGVLCGCSAVAAQAVDGWIGRWRSYSDYAFQHLGDLSIRPGAFVFAKAGTLKVETKEGYYRVIGVVARRAGGFADVCGDAPPRSAALVAVHAPEKDMLRINFYDTTTGPGPNPDFDPHRCGYVVYTKGAASTPAPPKH